MRAHCTYTHTEIAGFSTNRQNDRIKKKIEREHKNRQTGQKMTFAKIAHRMALYCKNGAQLTSQ